MRALITNDDGVDSVGLCNLAKVAQSAGLDIVVAAPHQERSGASASLSSLEEGGRLLMEQRRLEDVDVPALAVQASPAMIVFTAVRGAFGDPPDIVLSGINHGPNTGQAILHSGTVGAALTAATQGLPAMAVSLASGRPTHFDTAAHVAERALKWFLDHCDEPYTLNVNVPDVPVAEVRGLCPAGLAAFGAVQAHVHERGRGHATITFSEIDDQAEPGTDVALLRERWAPVTKLFAPADFGTGDLESIRDF